MLLNIFLSACFLFAVGTASATTLIGMVVGVSDGDTITVLDSAKVQNKIRLTGIDAPEKAQAFGVKSKQYLSDLVYAKNVVVEWEKKDRYGRILGKVIVDGRDANLAQLRAGMAWHYKQYAIEQSVPDRTQYAVVEATARGKRIGLWQDSYPVLPSDYRRGTKTASQATLVNAGDVCLCSEERQCTGPRGGVYCMTQTGKKRY